MCRCVVESTSGCVSQQSNILFYLVVLYLGRTTAKQQSIPPRTHATATLCCVYICASAAVHKHHSAAYPWCPGSIGAMALSKGGTDLVGAACSPNAAAAFPHRAGGAVHLVRGLVTANMHHWRLLHPPPTLSYSSLSLCSASSIAWRTGLASRTPAAS